VYRSIVSIALLLAVGVLVPSTASAAFEVHGGIRQAYVVDAKRGQLLELVNEGIERVK